MDFPNCARGWAGGWGSNGCPRTRVGELNLIFWHCVWWFSVLRLWAKGYGRCPRGGGATGGLKSALWLDSVKIVGAGVSADVNDLDSTDFNGISCIIY